MRMLPTPGLIQRPPMTIVAVQKKKKFNFIRKLNHGEWQSVGCRLFSSRKERRPFNGIPADTSASVASSSKWMWVAEPSVLCGSTRKSRRKIRIFPSANGTHGKKKRSKFRVSHARRQGVASGETLDSCHERFRCSTKGRELGPVWHWRDLATGP